MAIVNAKIKSTTLGIEDHGIMTFMIYLEWPGAAQGFGGYSLDGHVKDAPRKGFGMAYQAIRQILETLEVNCWEKLPGTLVRIEESSHRLDKIGHIMKDSWFNLREWNEKYQDQ